MKYLYLLLALALPLTAQTLTNTNLDGVTNAALNGKLDDDPSATRTALGLGTAATKAVSDFSANVPVSSGVILGDSTIAAYAGQVGVETYLRDPANTQAGSTVTSLAVPGETIDQQKARWVADANKATYDWVIVQVGLNDVVDDTVAAPVAINKLQVLVDTINAGKKAGAKVIICTMVPAKSRFFSLLGSTNGATAYARWASINAAISGGASAVTGVDLRISSHTARLNDGAGNLMAPYDTGDGIHTTNSGREIQAAEWARGLNALGFWKSRTPSDMTPIGNNPASGLVAVNGNKIIIGDITSASNPSATVKSISTGNTFGSNPRGSAANLKIMWYDHYTSGAAYQYGIGMHVTGIDFLGLPNSQYGWWSGTVEYLNLSGTGNLSLLVAGRTLSVKSGSNALSGTFTANGTTPVAVATTAWDANCAAIITLKTSGGTGPTMTPFVSSVTPGTGFSVVSTVGDTSIYNWVALKVN